MLVEMGLKFLILAPIQMVGGILMTVLLSPSLALIFLCMIPFLAMAYFIINRFASPLYAKMQQLLDKLNLYFKEGLTGVKVIRAFDKEEQEYNKYLEVNREYTRASITAGTIMSFFIPVLTMLISLTKLYVTDQQGHIFYPGEALGEQFNISASERIKIEGINYIVASKISDYTGLNIIRIIDERQSQKDAMALINFTLVISIVSIFLAIVMAVFFSNSIVKPVRHLKGKLKKIQAGNFKERAEIFRNDEIGSLAEGFNVVVSEINRLVMEVYETQLRERDAELSASQSQINPHFLHNTFELVNMIAIENDQFEIIAAGRGDNLFMPGESVTRAEFLAMLLNAFDLTDENADCTFKDVNDGKWYYNAIATAQKLGIVQGKTDGTFGVNDAITRQDMAVMTILLRRIMQQELKQR